MDPLLEVTHLSKSFGGVWAVKTVSFRLNPREILGLIGPNGAGKTTLFNVIAGVYKPDSGKVVFKGRTVSGSKPFQICHLGIARTFQIVKPFSTLTVAENVMIGARFGKCHDLVDRWDFRQPALDVLDFLGLDEKRDVPCASLNLAEQKKVALARALATQPELLLLDEAMAGLNAVETDHMLESVRRIREQKKISILMIEHIMGAVMGLSDRVIVLHHGEKIADDVPQIVVQKEEVIEAYLGERIV
jgi:branched-chain amino acid transport system ATP-binding protein